MMPQQVEKSSEAKDWVPLLKMESQSLSEMTSSWFEAQNVDSDSGAVRMLAAEAKELLELRLSEQCNVDYAEPTEAMINDTKKEYAEIKESAKFVAAEDCGAVRLPTQLADESIKAFIDIVDRLESKDVHNNAFHLAGYDSSLKTTFSEPYPTVNVPRLVFRHQANAMFGVKNKSQLNKLEL